MPGLVGDVGATNVRLARSTAAGQLLEVKSYLADNFTGLADVIQHYLTESALPAPKVAVLALAGPQDPDGTTAILTNRAWSMSPGEIRAALNLEQLHIVNDFAAIAHALPLLEPPDLRIIGPNVEGEARGTKAVLGPGSGLGVAGLVASKEQWSVMSTEGGHTSLSPTTSRHIRILERLWETFPHLSAERVLSGPGLVNLYHAIAPVGYDATPDFGPADITRLAIDGSDPFAVETLDVFFELLGSFAGNLALSLGAKGGVYIGGGIGPRVADALSASSFREQFIAKGRFRDYLDNIPTYLIIRENPGLLGLTRVLYS